MPERTEKWQVICTFQRMLFLTSLNQGYHKPVLQITYLVKGFIVFSKTDFFFSFCLSEIHLVETIHRVRV